MNNKEREIYRNAFWEKEYYEKAVEKFPPRIQRILSENKLKEMIDEIPYLNKYFYGKSRTGKTVTLYRSLLGFLRVQHQKNRRGDYIFITASDLADELRSIDGYARIQFKKKLKNCALLIIDDIGVEKQTDWIYAEMYSIIDYRFNYDKITWFSSNYDLIELQNRWQDTRITSRIYQMCKETITHFQNKPY